VVAATNQDLERAIGTRQFRPDLYYRLSVFPIRIPPLRERREDIPALARYFARHFSTKLRRNIDGVTPAALERLQSYDWPGNIRELQNVLERAVILTGGTAIEPDATTLIPPWRSTRKWSPSPRPSAMPLWPRSTRRTGA
jgi:transcriptional regulator with GAF, ATPase, and Fis domain